MKMYLAMSMAILLVGSACTSQEQARLDANKAVVARFTAAINERNLALLDDFVSKDVVRHCQATPDVNVRNLADLKAFLEADFQAVPDSRITVDIQVAEGDKVAVYASYQGRQTGQMGPFPASGKPIDLKYLSILRLENGKIEEFWVEWDNVTILSQLGYMPDRAD